MMERDIQVISDILFSAKTSITKSARASASLAKFAGAKDETQIEANKL